MNARGLILAAVLFAACSNNTIVVGSDGALPAGLDAAAPGRDAALPAGLDAATLEPDAAAAPGLDAEAPSSRTLVDRPILPTSPQNLLLDPFVTADESWGHFVSFYLTAGGHSVSVNLPRTYQSASPVGMASPILRLANLGVDAGSTDFRVVAKTLGGSGTFQASLWVSAGDASGQPVPYASAASSLQVWILSADASVKLLLQADLSSAKTIEGREWVQLTSGGSVSLPHGQWFEVDVVSFASSWLLAAPQLVPDSPAPPDMIRRSRTPIVPADDSDRAAVLAYGELVKHR